MTKRFCLIFALLILATTGHAVENKAAPKLSAAMSMNDTLKGLMGTQTPVEIVLGNGKVYGGFVKEVGTGTVLLTKLSQKEFYDAMIKIEDISAVEVRMRGN